MKFRYRVEWKYSDTKEVRDYTSGWMTSQECEKLMGEDVQSCKDCGDEVLAARIESREDY